MAMNNSPPGTTVPTDHTGTHVCPPEGATQHTQSPSQTFIARPPYSQDRYFDVNYSTAWRGPTTPTTLIRYNPETQVSNTLYSMASSPTKLESMESSVAIFVDGAYRGNGTAESRAGYGVFFGNDSKYNMYGPVDPSFKQTSQVAEIIAVLKALDQVADKVREVMGLMEVVIVSDSEYLVKSMCEYIWKWLRNGFKNSTGRKVENEVLLRRLHDRIVILDEECIEVKFWHVERDPNQEARRLANLALD